MQDSLKPYSQYKESGIHWLSKYPADWEMLKTKYLFTERVEKGYPNEPLLAATQAKGVVPKTLYETRTVIAQKDLHLLKLVEPGDFVISLRSFQGGIEKAYYRGIISPAYTVLSPSNKISGGYFKHLAKSNPFIKLLTTCVTGIREGQNIDYEILRRTKIPVPPLTHQHQIVQYLDWKTTQIAKFIKAKKRMIKLLNEQMQVIINDTVTGKIDISTGKPYPKYKNSGVEWLGMVPEEWDVRRVKSLSIVKRGASPRPIDDPKYFNEKGEYAWVRIADVTASDKYLEKTTQRLSELGNSLSVKIEPGQIFLSIAGSIGKPIISSIKCCIHDGFVYFPLFKGNVEFLYYLLSSGKLYEGLGKLGTQLNLNTGTVGSIHVPIPPTDEQNRIINYIIHNSLNLSRIVTHIVQEISLVQEYRTRLIADVVTGKVDVRNIAVPEFKQVDIFAELGETTDNEEVLDDTIVDNDL